MWKKILKKEKSKTKYENPFREREKEKRNLPPQFYFVKLSAGAPSRKRDSENPLCEKKDSKSNRLGSL